MTRYEWFRWLARPALPAMYSRVHRDLRRLIRTKDERPVALLDVGARKSPYTIGLNAAVTLIDLPRTTDVQKALHLGLDNAAIQQVLANRSNVVDVVLADMADCELPPNAFDIVACVEVVEHVRNLDGFLAAVTRVLKPDGCLYITTPNGDYVKNEPPNYNPDHLRHFTRCELDNLLRRSFADVSVHYGIKTGKHRYNGLRPMRLRQPLRLMHSVASNLLSRIESIGLDDSQRRTAHLFAVARAMHTQALHSGTGHSVLSRS